jgi:hypothetical protein
VGGLSMSAAAEQVRKKEIAVRFLEWNAQLTAAEIPLVARSVARLNAAFGPEESEAKALASRVAYCYARPDWFVAEFFPWGEGELSSYAGPDTWQEGFLREWGEEIRLRGFDGVTPVTPLRFATSSGHGIGKTTVVAWIAAFLLSTRPYSQGTVTANTFPQLEAKTWASICRWLKLCKTRPWFQIGADRIYMKNQPDSWFLRALTAQNEKSESFAGQHAANSSSYYIFDEASAIPESIWQVAEGGTTDGEPHWFCFGNPTRNSGRFFESCFGREKHRWKVRSIDARESGITNKTQLAEWVTEYGEDSDFVRVRVRGIPPRAGDLQFIDSERVWEARNRPVVALPNESLVCGVDVARGGMDSNVICYRRGVDARSLRAEKIPGEQTRDLTLLVSKLAGLLSDGLRGQPIAMMFIDGAGVGAGLYHRLSQLGYRNVTEVQFGGKPPDPHYANMRSYMWGKMKDWLLRGSIPDDTQLEIDLTGPGYFHDRTDRLVLESKEDMKKRGLASPDYGDALALTFAQPVVPVKPKTELLNRPGSGRQFSWGS